MSIYLLDNQNQGSAQIAGHYPSWRKQLTRSIYSVLLENKSQGQVACFQPSTQSQSKFMEEEYVSAQDQQFLEELKKYILFNINSSLLKTSLLASHLNMSTSTFERKIKILTKNTPGKLIIKIRLDYAKELIVSKGNIGIEEIANKVGFKSASSFTRSFKNEYGCSPSSLRRDVQ